MSETFDRIVLGVGGFGSGALYHLAVERLPPAQARRRVPGFAFRDDFVIVVEPQAGYLEVENCVAAHVSAAVRHGAVLRTHETVTSWDSDGSRVRVQTDRGEYTA